MENERTVLGFSDNPFMIGYDNRIFEYDDELGFRFPKGNLVGLDTFYSLDFLIGNIKWRTGYPVILNMGDSSTSGWNGNKVFRGNRSPYAPFFTYRTYSDILRENPSYQNTINAGVPGYTSLQGRKYLERLLKKFSREGIQLDYVTLYFGNNDSVYNRFEDKVRLDAKKESQNAKGERVTVEDYIKNIEYMIDTIREYGAKPIVIVPPIHYDHEPGIRSNFYRAESVEVLRQIEGTDLARELLRAREFYEKGRYRYACEMDRVLPRLKAPYKKALLGIYRRKKVPKIDIQRNIPFTHNEEYFIDYCHPNEKTNIIIANKIRDIRRRDIFHKSIFLFVTNELFNLFRRKRKIDGPPSDVYTVY